MIDPSDELLAEGAELLKPVLEPYGFKFMVAKGGGGSGGYFAVGKFVAGDREIELWVRLRLGGVRYRKFDVEAQHVAYMQAIGRGEVAAYPGFGEPLDGFCHLIADLEYCSAFLLDEGRAFYRLMKNYQYRAPKGLDAI